MSSTTKMQWIHTMMVAGLLMAGALPRASAQKATGSIHGHVQNAAGIAVNGGDVKLTTDAAANASSTFKYDVPVDKNGNYQSNAIAPDTYFIVYFQDSKEVDGLPNIKIVAGQDTAADIDMTRADYIKTMTPEERKALEDYKVKIAGAMSENAKIASLNNSLQQARTDMKASHANCTTTVPDNAVCPPSSSDYDNAASLMEQAVSVKPDQDILWLTLGDAQAGQKKYDDAATSYNKAIALNDASKKPSAELHGAAYNNLGQALANDGKTADAIAAFDAAVKAQPTQAATYYFNEAAVFYNHGDTTTALAAADKAIAADPTKPEPYYIRGQSLIVNATVDKSGKIIAPPGCAEAYQKYLELAPDGQHVQDVTDVLNSLGQTIHSTYKAKKN
jgi:tetratricopeptide (TPR) repeat protein